MKIKLILIIALILLNLNILMAISENNGNLIGIIKNVSIVINDSVYPELEISFDRNKNDFIFKSLNSNNQILLTSTYCNDIRCIKKTNSYFLSNEYGSIFMEVKIFNNRMTNTLEIVKLDYSKNNLNKISVKPKAKLIVKNPVINREYSQFLRSKDETVNVNYNHFKNYTKVFIKKTKQKPVITIIDKYMVLIINTEEGKIISKVIEESKINMLNKDINESIIRCDWRPIIKGRKYNTCVALDVGMYFDGNDCIFINGCSNLTNLPSGKRLFNQRDECLKYCLN
jgi:hypothetical protein